MSEYSLEVRRLAGILHLDCNSNHTDGCGWFYGEHGREYKYQEAEKLLPQLKKTGITLDQLEEWMLVLHPTRADWLYIPLEEEKEKEFLFLHKGEPVICMTISYRVDGHKASMSCTPQSAELVKKGLERDGATDIKIAHYFGKSGMIK